MQNNAIEVKNLKKYYGKQKAVDGISFSIKQGEIFGFLGPNGAGKSTTIRCILGLNKPTDGNVSILGYDMSGNDVKVKKHLGYLPCDIQLYDNWTGWDHIRFFESVRGKSKIVYNLIKRLDFNPDINFRHLSSGNKQKLGLILALMYQPKVIILDEPTVGLDPLLQSEFHKILLEFKKLGCTIFISSHNLAEVQKICDRAAIIKNGKLVTVETIGSLSDKKLYTINIRFSEKIQPGDFNLKCVKDFKQLDGMVSINAAGDINQLVSVISRYKIADMQIEHASLEDIFMKFYEERK